MVGDTRTALFHVLEIGRDQGLNPRETARAIQKFIPSGRFVNAGPKYRAQLISRTETLHSMRMASLEQYAAAPNVDEVVAFDGDQDEECAARNGQTFSVGDATVEAEATHPNCVLAFGPKIT